MQAQASPQGSGRFDWAVYPGTRIAGLPRVLRPLALVVRNLVPDGLRLYRYAYRADDLGTRHHNPFLEDPDFDAAYRRVADRWRNGLEDRRWRTWLLSRMARAQTGVAASEPANLAEFGVHRGGCASIILSAARLAPEQRFFLFDTFAGIPDEHLTAAERERGLAGQGTDTSVEEVKRLLSPWASQLSFHPGDVFTSLDETEVGRLGFVHIDINVTAATVLCLEYAYPRLVPGATMVLDDYGAIEFREMRLAVDEFFADKPEDIIALPTSQGLVLKR